MSANLLIVDDSTSMRQMVAFALSGGGYSVKEAEDGDVLRPGLALLAPGGKQMMIDARGVVKILPGDERLNYKPCVDITFGSVAKSYGDKVLAVVLTGMGADGREGARLLKQGGSQVWAQDEASCVIYGMPMAIVKANLADAMNQWLEGNWRFPSAG